jgi:ubiquinone/menaquinone biosynthesis C-methylase UbiE
MTEPQSGKLWTSGEIYEPYVGRWSRRVAPVFIRDLPVPVQSRWLDVGCGTGALSQTTLQTAAPRAVKGIDRSEGFVEYARAYVTDPRAHFEVGDAQALPEQDSTYDAAVSGLVLNFVPAPQQMVAEMARVTKPGGVVALYVWDYADKMQLMRYFWDAAAALDPAARDLDEARRSPICHPEPLAQLFRDAGLHDVQVEPIDAQTDFVDFDDYWSPFLRGGAPAPSYAISLSEKRRAGLRNYLQAALPIEEDGSIHLIARAWAVRGIVSPGSSP